jgi:hypothetical protein
VPTTQGQTQGIEKMKPSQKDRCPRAAARDFLVGLAVFLTVFTLAMLDSRASRSAPAPDFKPVSLVRIDTIPSVNISPRTDNQEMLRRNGDAYSLRSPQVVTPRYALKPQLQPVKYGEPAGVSGPQTKFSNLQKLASLQERKYSVQLANEDLPRSLSADRIKDAGEVEPYLKGLVPAPEDIVEPAEKSSKLAMNGRKTRANSRSGPGTLDASGRSWILTVMALIFAVMTTLTLGLWRHLRHAVAPRKTGRRV